MGLEGHAKDRAAQLLVQLVRHVVLREHHERAAALADHRDLVQRVRLQALVAEEVGGRHHCLLVHVIPVDIHYSGSKQVLQSDRQTDIYLGNMLAVG